MIHVTVTQDAYVDEDEFFEGLLKKYNPRQILVMVANAMVKKERHSEDYKKLSEFLATEYHDSRFKEFLEDEKNRFKVK